MTRFAFFILVALCGFNLAALAQDMMPCLPTSPPPACTFCTQTIPRMPTRTATFLRLTVFPRGWIPLVNFTDHFEAQGVLFDGTAHHIWEYSMVGNPPNKGGTTVFNAPVVPVSLDLRNADGSPRFVKVVNGAVVTCGQNGVPLDNTCTRLFSDVTPFIQPFLNGPVFSNANFTSSPVPTQITDAVQRAEFGDQAKPDWHTLLAPSVKTAEVMILLAGTYVFALNPDGSCCRFVLINSATFNNKLFPQNPAGPDNTSIIGQAEVAGNITTRDVSTFFFPNAFLFNGNVNNCCVLGFHTFDFEPGNAINLPSNGNLQRFFVLNYSSWISPGLFRRRVTGRDRSQPRNR